jgi:hypothetical protein
MSNTRFSGHRLPENHLGWITAQVGGRQALDLDGTAGHRVIFYYAEPGTPAYDVMVLLDMDQPRPGTGPAPDTSTANRYA